MAPIDGKGPVEDPEDFIDHKGYWADPGRNIRRVSGEQDVVLRATNGALKPSGFSCSKV
jgi:hypothetical protein